MAWSLVGSATATAHALSIACNAPTGLASGDLLVAHLAVDSSAVTVTAPTGWTQRAAVQINGGTTPYTYVFDKQAGSSEPSSYTFSISGSSNVYLGCQIDAYSGLTTSTTYLDTSATATGSSWGTLSLTLANANELVIYSLMANNTGTVSLPSGYTSVGSFSWSSGVSTENGYDVYAASGATGNIAGTSGTSANSVIAVAYIPASGGTALNTAATLASDSSISGNPFATRASSADSVGQSKFLATPYATRATSTQSQARSTLSGVLSATRAFSAVSNSRAGSIATLWATRAFSAVSASKSTSVTTVKKLATLIISAVVAARSAVNATAQKLTTIITTAAITGVSRLVALANLVAIGHVEMIVAETAFETDVAAVSAINTAAVTSCVFSQDIVLQIPM